MNEYIKEFFDSKAKTWDLKEKHDKNWFRNFLSEFTHITPGMKILDLGCGTGVITDLIYELSKVKVTGIDIAPSMIDAARSKIDSSHAEFIVGDFYNLKLPKFDMIIIHNAYPHFLDREEFKKSCLKSLQNQGILLILHSVSREFLDNHPSHNKDLARKLLEVNEEASFYKDEFIVIRAFENEEMYLIELEKKN